MAYHDKARIALWTPAMNFLSELKKTVQSFLSVTDTQVSECNHIMPEGLVIFCRIIEKIRYIHGSYIFPHGGDFLVEFFLYGWPQDNVSSIVRVSQGKNPAKPKYRIPWPPGHPIDYGSQDIMNDDYAA